MINILSGAKGRALLLLGASFIAVGVAPLSQATVVNGAGSAPISKDVESVRTAAMREAKRAAVRAMLSSVIGEDRMREISVQHLDALAAQIRPDMIVDQQAERLGQEFTVTLSVDFDAAQFNRRLSDLNIASSSQLGNAQEQLMVVYLTTSEGTASDFSQPAETNFEYDSSKGSSYSDRSSVGASSREASGDSYRSASGSSRRSAGGYSGYYGSGAASARSSSASSTSSSSASSASSSYAQQNNVSFDTHDNVRVRHRVVYQKPPVSKDGDAIMNGLTDKMSDYGVKTAYAWQHLSSAFPDGVPNYDDLKRDVRFKDFLSVLRANRTPFFMGGSFRITHNGPDVGGSGNVSCSGSLDAAAFSSELSDNIASGAFNASAMGQSPEECSGRLTEKLAGLAAERMGSNIDRHWRDKARSQQGQNSREVANYRVILRGQSITLDQQQAFVEAVSAINGASVENFIGASGQQMELIVRYSGTLPLHFPLSSALKHRSDFPNIQSQVQGRNITLCLSGCGF